MQRITVAVVAALGTSAALAVDAGQLAFTSFNADEDGWSVVALTDLAAGTTI